MWNIPLTTANSQEWWRTSKLFPASISHIPKSILTGICQHGAGDFDLQMKGQTSRFLLMTLEARVTHVLEWGNLSLIPMIYAGWQRNFLHQENNSEFRLAGMDEKFTTYPLKKLGTNYALAGIDLAFYFHKKYGVEVSYDFSWNSGYRDNRFYLGFDYLF